MLVVSQIINATKKNQSNSNTHLTSTYGDKVFISEWSASLKLPMFLDHTLIFQQLSYTSFGTLLLFLLLLPLSWRC